MKLTRSDLERGRMQAIFSSSAYNSVLSDAELKASLASTLKDHPCGSDLWVFAYGSLIWNPLLHYVEQRPARLHGMHRSFCLWSRASRGTPKQPGLVLGLDRGGCCPGVAFRIAATGIESELSLLWRREMVVGSYHPRWLDASTTSGNIRVIAFVVNRSHPQYAGKLSHDQTATTIAAAKGELGSSADYLRQTHEALRAHGIEDPRIALLVGKVNRLAPHSPADVHSNEVPSTAPQSVSPETKALTTKAA